MDIHFLTRINKNTAYCLLKGSESGSFGLRSSVFQPVSKENRATGMIADNQIIFSDKGVLRIKYCSKSKLESQLKASVFILPAY